MQFRADVRNVRVGRRPAGDALGGIAARDLDEDQVGDEADGDEHQNRTDQPPDEEGNHQRSILTFARGSRASRRPSPKTLRDSTVSTIAMPGMIASQGAVTILS